MSFGRNTTWQLQLRKRKRSSTSWPEPRDKQDSQESPRTITSKESFINDVIKSKTKKVWSKYFRLVRTSHSKIVTSFQESNTVLGLVSFFLFFYASKEVWFEYQVSKFLLFILEHKIQIVTKNLYCLRFINRQRILTKIINNLNILNHIVVQNSSE